ncbi:signal peptide peptidase SppA [Sphingobacterium sp. lm-10]|uniref:signal peptide peptidase SppA n=1 Tax=Sphingobacterium sp. lm-10 TaxID=2944904 RepID=UPI002021AC24|nr:signal peptide peptidase SppA [Sphingobacterium sp. lm-10]MCL7987891.1 signal peptide peptidase SppA [Sphingobacterium sp. lm-10]
MKQFFKYVLATVVGVIISSILVVIVFVGIITAMVSSLGSGGEPTVSANSVLHVTLDHQITEKTVPSPFEDINIPGSPDTRSIGLNDIVSRIKAAKTDSNIKGIYLNVSTVNAGFATLRAIRNALIDFKESGKFIVSYSDVMTQKAYYVSSVANEIYISPVGSVDFRGLSSSVMFMKDALDKLGVEMQVVKVGTYKSAVEPFILNEMSAANRLQVNAYLNSLYDSFVSDIATSRSLDEQAVRQVANDYLIQFPEDAVKQQFVDSLLYRDQLLAKLKEKVGIDQKKDLSSISLLEYRKSADAGSSAGSGRIAVLYAFGDIVDGNTSGAEQIGGESLSRELRKLREDDKVKAIVLRVNSPGGSALASDLIWREVSLAKQAKPVIVSMGDYAASGGYYISAAADSIFADAGTLTGSIGVFGLIPNLQNLFNNKLGLHFDVVKTGPYADVNVDRPMTSEERTIIQGGVNRIYQQFMQRVADGRGLTVAQVDSIGQGRVWTGTQAIELGLVDRLGTLDDAIKSAAKMAKLENYKVSEYPRTKDPFESIFSSSKEKVKMWLLKDELGEHVRYVNDLKRVMQNTGIQARIPYEIEIY